MNDIKLPNYEKWLRIFWKTKPSWISKKNNILLIMIIVFENGGFNFRQNAIDMIKNLKNKKNG